MDYFALGRRIRARRRSLGWNQEYVAEIADIAVSFFGHIERGTRKASMETFVKIANALQISPSVLLLESINVPEIAHQARKQLILAVIDEIYRYVEQSMNIEDGLQD